MPSRDKVYVASDAGIDIHHYRLIRQEIGTTFTILKNASAFTCVEA